MPDPDDLRPIPDLQPNEDDCVPLAIVCPNCNGIYRITYPSWHSRPRQPEA
jgi:hypothetical protein